MIKTSGINVNIFYNILGGGGRFFVLVVATPLLVRFLRVENYGTWTIVSSITNLLILSDGGLSLAATYFSSKILGNQEAIKNRELSQLLINIFIILALTILIILIILYVFHIPIHNYLIKRDIETEMYYGLATAFFILVQQILVGFLQGFEDYKSINLIKFINVLILNLGWVLLAFNKYPILNMVIYGLIISILTVLVVSFIVFKKFKLYAIYPQKNEIYSILGYSIPCLGIQFGGTFFTQLDKIVVSIFFDNKIVGIYAVITTICSYINNISSLPVQPYMPLVIKLAEIKDRIQIKKLFYKASVINSSIALLVALTIIIFSSHILMFLLKDSFKYEYIYFLIIAASIYFLYSLNATGYFFLLALKKQTLIMNVQILGGVLSLLLIYLLTSKYGLKGSILGNVGFVITVYLNYCTYKLLKI